MALISDSDAVLDIKRILPQHQSAITLLNTILQNPGVTDCFWLDLACGKGQIISQLAENLSDDNRNKLSYTGYDIHVDHTRTAERIASNLNLKAFAFCHGELSLFTNNVNNTQKYDFITCTNTAHELQPGAFAAVVIDSVLRLSTSGQLFLYDMQSLIEPELGALPWRGPEIGVLINSVFEILESDYKVHPSTWSHSTCKGWSIVVQKQYIAKTDEELLAKRDEISARLDQEIDRILDVRFEECNRLLQSYCRYGTETANDESSKMAALYEFWALHKAKEVRQ
jgi:SAM-dependent methyltransferase